MTYIIRNGVRMELGAATARKREQEAQKAATKARDEKAIREVYQDAQRIDDPVLLEVTRRLADRIGVTL